MKKIFCWQLPLNRFLTKTLKVNKNCHEKFLKNLSFEVIFKVKVPEFMRSYGVIMTDQLCMYVCLYVYKAEGETQMTTKVLIRWP